MLVVSALWLASCGGGGGGDGGGDGGGGAGGGGGGGGAGAGPTTANQSCPLTDEQTQQSVAAWSKIAQFLTTEPRCVNCHGAVNPYIDGVGIDSTPDSDGTLRPVSEVEHGGGQIDRPQPGTGTVDSACVSCHDNMVKPTANTPTVWTLPLASHSFLNKDPATLCRQIKGATRTAERFMAHMENDEGFSDFVDTSFLGNRGLGELKPEDYRPPSIGKGQFLQMGRDWVDAMGGSFQGDESCGCEPRHSGWSGEIHIGVQTQVQRQRDSGVATGWSLDTVNIAVTDGRGTYSGKATLTYQDPEASWDGAPITEATEASGKGAVAVELEVDVDAAGKYTIRLTYPSGDIASVEIGTMTDTFCSTRFGTCNTQTRPVFMPQPPSPVGAPGGATPLTGTVTNPDRIQGSLAWATGSEDSAFGRIQNVVTVDLWRAPP